MRHEAGVPRECGQVMRTNELYWSGLYGTLVAIFIALVLHFVIKAHFSTS